MIDKHYRFLGSKNYSRYFFESEGRQGKVMKVVNFSLDKSGRWNLGFGDWRKGQIDDTIITNNYDVAKVIRTIAKITYTFFEQYPDRIVLIKPVDEKRKRLYNLVFQRHISDFEATIEVIGFINQQPETYSVEKNYDTFEIKLKSKS